MKTDPTWKDVDDIVNLRTISGVKVSLANLESALASSDNGKVRSILAALRGPTKEHESDLYPFGGVRLTLDIQKRRVEKWYEGEQLVTTLYTQALARAKEKRTSEEAEAAAPSSTASKAKKSVPAKTEDSTDSSTASTPPKRGHPPKKKLTKVVEVIDQIKFDHLQNNEALVAYVPQRDSNYVFPAWTPEFCTMLDNSMNLWLYGGTGAGKSSLVEQVCAVGKLPVMYQSFHEDIKPCELLGGKELVDGNTVWVDGPVTRAYREGFILLLDEIDAFPPEVQFCLYGILDRKPLVLAENGNEVVQPHPNFRAVATANTQGRGDESGMYVGTNILNHALLNRFRPWYEVEYPSENVYQDIITREGASTDVAKVIAQLAKEINTAFMAGTLTETFSLRGARQIAKVAELVEGDVSRALQICFFNRLSSVEKSAVTELFRRLVPDDM